MAALLFASRLPASATEIVLVASNNPDAPGLALAESEARNANDYWQFTSIINKRFTQPQKVRVIELLWEVAYADAGLNAYEEHLIRKLADLLHISHGDYITAKLRARDTRDPR